MFRQLLPPGPAARQGDWRPPHMAQPGRLIEADVTIIGPDDKQATVILYRHKGGDDFKAVGCLIQNSFQAGIMAALAAGALFPQPNRMHGLAQPVAPIHVQQLAVGLVFGDPEQALIRPVWKQIAHAQGCIR